ncbi:multiple C2 and transmembrane domain-containing protein 2 isoform X2 [Brachyhypopomus gauderio]|uniref:multiple C2 and transmembrane domain-containing protein 2 isoform X2 n=1 Tax=Brachyhypopomus gauderio TaxID=698409 RepID=UPI004041C245
METKKSTVFTRLREKAKPLFNMKKGRRNRKTPLTYRRSISVPDLRCTVPTPSLLDSLAQPRDPDTGSFSDIKSNFYLEEADTETSSLAYSDNFAVTDEPSKCSDQFTFPLDMDPTLETAPPSGLPEQLPVPRTPLLTQDVDQFSFPDTLSQHTLPEIDILLTSEMPAFVEAPLRKASSDNRPFSLSDSLSSAVLPELDILLPSEKPVFLEVPARKDKQDKRVEERDRTTTWYIGHLDSESACSTPSDDRSCSPCPPEQELTEATSPISRDMCIAGTAENLFEVTNESNDYDTDPSRREMLSSAGSSEVQVGSAGQKVQYILSVVLKEGRNLVIRDRCGTSDPYVKFRLYGKTLYKSKVVYKNLNPVWNEPFSVSIRTLDQCVDVMVFDRDLRSHEFMGSSVIDLSKLELGKKSEMTLALQDPDSLKEDMGVIILDASVTIQEGPTKRYKWQLKRKGSFNKGHPQVVRTTAVAQKSQVWSGVYTLVLVEGQDMPDGGQADVYVRFRLGEQRCRSKCLCIRASPQWRETFDFNRFADGQPDVLVAEVLCKRNRRSEELWGAPELNLSQHPLYETRLHTLVVGAGKGRLLLQLTLRPCSGVSICELSAAPLDEPSHCERMQERYSLRNTLASLQDVGYLQVKVVRATDLASTDLSGKSDPFCVLELGNSRLQTPTIYKTIHPEWRTAFTLPIKDVHDVLVLTVFGEDGDKAPDVLGKVAIPLLTVSSGQQISSLLKKEDLAGPAKGSITLEMNVLYNPVRAAVKTFKPRETKFEEDNPKFNKKLLARNIYRVRRLSTAVLYTLQYIKSCFEWESKKRSITAFLIFLVTVWHFELFMLPLFLLLLFGWKYVRIIHGVGSHPQDLESMSLAEDEDEDEKESEKRGLMEKIHMVQEIVLTVQNVLDEVACIGERVKNTFNWSVPFLSTLACCVLFIATVTLYYIPLRYVVLLWGVNKFTKKLRDPHGVANNKLLDFLQRVPSDVQKVQYSELRAPGVPSAQKKRR